MYYNEKTGIYEREQPASVRARLANLSAEDIRCVGNVTRQEVDRAARQGDPHEGTSVAIVNIEIY